MNVLITGGTGFIGSRLAFRCLERGHRVRVLGRIATDAEIENSRELKKKGVQVMQGSVTDANMSAEAVRGTDWVFHLAAAQHEANIPDKTFWDVNVTGTRNLLEACTTAGIARFVHGSTIGVYGSTDGQVDEDSPCRPENIYGITKLEGERVVRSYMGRLPAVIIRISETYGPGDRRLLKVFRALERGLFFIIGDGQNLHQLIYVDDLVDGLLQAAGLEASLGETVLLAGSRPVSTNDLVDTIARSLNTDPPSFHLPLYPFIITAFVMEKLLRPMGIQPPLHRRRLDFFRKSFSFQTNKAKKVLDFTPRQSLEQGLAETATWYREAGYLRTSGKNGHPRSSPIMVDRELSAHIEPFDTFWEAPDDLESGFQKFGKFYKRNYFRHMPMDKSVRTLVISCGPGYMMKALAAAGYSDVVGIDSDPEKVAVAGRHGLKSQVANAFAFLRENRETFDLIFAEQEINHLTKEEILRFLALCRKNLSENGVLFVHSLNGANPITGSEALAQNFNHFNTFTEYSLHQVLRYTGFRDIRVFPLRLYVFYENPLNYIGSAFDFLLNRMLKLSFAFYGKKNRLFSKKIAAVCLR